MKNDQWKLTAFKQHVQPGNLFLIFFFYIWLISGQQQREQKKGLKLSALQEETNGVQFHWGRTWQHNGPNPWGTSNAHGDHKSLSAFASIKDSSSHISKIPNFLREKLNNVGCYWRTSGKIIKWFLWPLRVLVLLRGLCQNCNCVSNLFQHDPGRWVGKTLPP